jgi:hypothetical protein
VVGDNRLKQGGAEAVARARASFEQALRLAEQAGLAERFGPLLEQRLASIERLAAGDGLD